MIRKIKRLLGSTGMMVVAAVLAVKFSEKIKDMAKDVPVVGNFLNS